MTDLSEATSIKLDMSLDELIGAEHDGVLLQNSNRFDAQRKKRKHAASAPVETVNGAVGVQRNAMFPASRGVLPPPPPSPSAPTVPNAVTPRPPFRAAIHYGDALAYPMGIERAAPPGRPRLQNPLNRPPMGGYSEFNPSDHLHGPRMRFVPPGVVMDRPRLLQPNVGPHMRMVAPYPRGNAPNMGGMQRPSGNGPPSVLPPLSNPNTMQPIEPHLHTEQRSFDLPHPGASASPASMQRPDEKQQLPPNWHNTEIAGSAKDYGPPIPKRVTLVSQMRAVKPLETDGLSGKGDAAMNVGPPSVLVRPPASNRLFEMNAASIRTMHPPRPFPRNANLADFTSNQMPAPYRDGPHPTAGGHLLNDNEFTRGLDESWLAVEGQTGSRQEDKRMPATVGKRDPPSVHNNRESSFASTMPSTDYSTLPYNANARPMRWPHTGEGEEGHAAALGSSHASPRPPHPPYSLSSHGTLHTLSDNSKDKFSVRPVLTTAHSPYIYHTEHAHQTSTQEHERNHPSSKALSVEGSRFSMGNNNHFRGPPNARIAADRSDHGPRDESGVEARYDEASMVQRLHPPPTAKPLQNFANLDRSMMHSNQQRYPSGVPPVPSGLSKADTNRGGGGGVKRNVNSLSANTKLETAADTSSHREDRGYDVIVTNVPRNLTAVEIQEAFCCLGDVIRTDIMLTSHGEHTGRVSVMYSNRQAAEEAVCRFDGGDLNGNTIRVFME